MTDVPADSGDCDQPEESQQAAEATATDDPPDSATTVDPAGPAGIRAMPVKVTGGPAFEGFTRNAAVELAKAANSVQLPDLLAGLRGQDLLGRLGADTFINSLTANAAFKDVARWTTQPPWSDIQVLLKSNRALNPALNPALRWSDQLTPPVLMNFQRSAAADLAAMLTGPSAITGWREALAAQTKLVGVSSAIDAVLATQKIGLASSLGNLKTLSVLASHNVDALTRWTDLARQYDTLPLSAASLASYRRYVGALGDRPDEHSLTMGALSSFSIGGAAASQVLLIDDGQADEDELLIVGEVSEQFTEELISPWRSAQIAAAEQLRERLAKLDRTIPDMLDGAWAEIDRPGPGQLEKLHSCAVEAVDRTLRAAASDDVVTAWITATGLTSSKNVVLHSEKGTLTRQARVRYLTRNRTGDRKLLDTQIMALSALIAELVGRFNAGKHASAGALAQAGSLLLQLEALLAQLLLPQE